MTTTPRLDSSSSDPTRALPPFVVVPDHVGTPVPPEPAEASADPGPSETGRVRRWSTGHSVAAAVVVLGVLVAGGTAVAARDGGTGTTGQLGPGGGPFGQQGGPFGQQNQQGPQLGGPQGHLPGQLPGQMPGQLPGQMPGQQQPGRSDDSSTGSIDRTGAVTT